MISLAGRGIGFEDRADRTQVFLAADRCGLRQVASDEVAFGIHLGIDAVIDQPTVLGDFNSDIVGSGADPFWV
jgi:hypothetical protein